MSARRTGDHVTGTEPAGRGPGGMYVHESGTPGSPAIVFLHGDGQSGRIWCEHMARLAGFHCLARDLPGFGQSNHLPSASRSETADLVAALIETRVPARRAHVGRCSQGRSRPTSRSG